MMKKVYVALLVVLTIISMSACIKREPEVNDMDYYKNKIIQLRIDNIDFGGSDYAYFKIGAVKVDPNSPERISFKVNGEDVGDLVYVNSTMVADGPIVIETLVEAWQLVVEYKLTADASPYTLTLSPSFNGIASDKVIFNMKNTKPQSGILEIKEYKNQ